MSDAVGAVCEIGRTSSRCSACGRGADPNEPYHWTILEYGPNTETPGCGAEFVRVVHTYAENRPKPEQSNLQAVIDQYGTGDTSVKEGQDAP